MTRKWMQAAAWGAAVLSTSVPGGAGEPGGLRPTFEAGRAIENRPSEAPGRFPQTPFAEPTPRTRTYADVQAALSALAARRPEAARKIEIGPSDSGQTIWGLAVGPSEGPQGGRPPQARHLVVAGHHGNEYGAVEVALALAESLVDSPLRDLTVYVVPVLNVGGYDARRRWEADARGAMRDPNRDYPGPCGTEGPFRLKSTKALADFIERERIVASATLHTYFPAVVYPWGVPAEDLRVPDEARFRELALAATQESGYRIGNSTEVIYSALGAYEDYAYWRLGTWSLLFEIGFSHYPSDQEVRRSVETNVPGLRRMLETAPREPVARHDFVSRCDARLAAFDRHDE